MIQPLLSSASLTALMMRVIKIVYPRSLHEALFASKRKILSYTVCDFQTLFLLILNANLAPRKVVLLQISYVCHLLFTRRI